MCELIIPPQVRANISEAYDREGIALLSQALQEDKGVLCKALPILLLLPSSRATPG